MFIPYIYKLYTNCGSLKDQNKGKVEVVQRSAHKSQEIAIDDVKSTVTQWISTA